MDQLLIAPFLRFDFMALALASLLILAVAAAPIGALVSLRDLEFVTDGLVHSVFPGLAIGVTVISGGTPVVAAGAAGVAAAVILTFVVRHRLGSDAGIAVVLTAAFSIGVIVVSASSYPGQLETLLFGQLLDVHADQVGVLAVLCAVALGLVVCTWRGQLFRAFDPVGAQAAGFRVLLIDICLNIAIALIVVAASATIGNLLVLGLLILPAAAARNLTGRVGPLIIVTGAIIALGAWLGLAVAFDASVAQNVSVSPSATVVLAYLAAYVVSLVARTVGSAVHWALAQGRARAEARSSAA